MNGTAIVHAHHKLGGWSNRRLFTTAGWFTGMLFFRRAILGWSQYRCLWRILAKCLPQGVPLAPFLFGQRAARLTTTNDLAGVIPNHDITQGWLGCKVPDPAHQQGQHGDRQDHSQPDTKVKFVEHGRGPRQSCWRANT